MCFMATNASSRALRTAAVAFRFLTPLDDFALVASDGAGAVAEWAAGRLTTAAEVDSWLATGAELCPGMASHPAAPSVVSRPSNTSTGATRTACIVPPTWVTCCPSVDYEAPADGGGSNSRERTVYLSLGRKIP